MRVPQRLRRQRAVQGHVCRRDLDLLVPVAVSSSHIAYGSIRMEPVFMILGQSAGTVAAMALDKNTDMYELYYAEIRNKLIEDGQVLN